MRNFLLGVLAVIVLAGAMASWVWYQRPQWLPQEWRQANPHSDDYMPTLYRWHDDQGRTQLTDRPPPDRTFEIVRINPEQNRIPAGQSPLHPQD